jgi:hypothetical protein
MRLLLPMPVVANTPTWLGRVSPRIPTGRSMVSSPGAQPPDLHVAHPLTQERQVGVGGGGHGGELGREALGLVEALAST